MKTGVWVAGGVGLALLGIAVADARGMGTVRGGLVTDAEIDAEATRLVASTKARFSRTVPGTTESLKAFVDARRRTLAPWVDPAVLEAFAAHESSGALALGFGDATWQAGFFELGIFQCPAGTSYEGARPTRPTRPTFSPPGKPGTVAGSAWGRIAATLGLDAQAWSVPDTSCRIGLVNLVRDHDLVAGRFPELFSTRGTLFDVAAPLLFAFSRGAGACTQVLTADRARLQATPDADRWVRFCEVVRTRFPQWAVGTRNVNRKLVLARKLGWVG